MTDWKNTIQEDLAAEQFHHNLETGNLSQEEKEKFEKTKEMFNEDMNKFLED